MAWANRTSTAIDRVDLNIIVGYIDSDRYLCGALHTRKGWYWWFSVDAHGHTLSAVTNGPFDTEMEAFRVACAVAGQ